MLVSATVPNIADIAAWIASGVTGSESALVYEVNWSYFKFTKLIKYVNIVWG